MQGVKGGKWGNAKPHMDKQAQTIQKVTSTQINDPNEPRLTLGSPVIPTQRFRLASMIIEAEGWEAICISFAMYGECVE
jgi:hypothetical protein